MSREIYTYADLTRLHENKYYSELNSYPMVTVTADLRKGLYGTPDVDQVEGILSADHNLKITEFRSIEKALNENWGTDQSKFSETIILSEYVRQRIAEAGEDKKQLNWLTGCMRNLGSLLSAVILLEQADVKPEDIMADGDRNIELFVEAWKYLARRDPYIKSFRKNMNLRYTKDIWDPILKLAFKTDDSFKDYDALVFLGFYYITPLQEKIMHLLEDAGFRIIFLIPYDERYPFVYEIWDETFSEKRGYPSKDRWHMERPVQDNPFGDVFDGKKDIQIYNKLQIREYASVMEFVDDVKKIKKQGYSIYSSNYKAANEVLRDYFPEEYGERKILSYPIGQFVNVLNRMWDDDLQTVSLDEDDLMECFSSGWLSVKGVSGRQYLKELTYVMPFFHGCHTVAEWTDRTRQLKKIRTEAIEPFLEDLDTDETVARWQEAIGNPMANFSMFAVETEKLDIILALIRQILDMASELFGKDRLIRVSDHMDKLDRILRMHEISNEMYAEERAIVGDIFEKLGQPGDFDAECSPADIANALNLFLCGRLEESEIQNNRVGLVYPMYQIDAACIKNKSRVHICMCDVDAMPGGNKEYVWPLTASLVRDCYDRTKNPLIINLMQIMESTALCNRYFMYSALKNKDVHISWVSSINDKLLAPSPYIKLICQATGIKLTPARRHLITYKTVADSPYGAGRIEEYDNAKMPSDMIKEAKMDYAVCPMKYVLGYIFEKYPTFQSEFNQHYALNALISSIYDLMKDEGMTVDEVYKNVMSLFPGLRKVEQRQIYDYISYDRRENDMDYGSRTECGEYHYTDQRLKIHYPNPDVRSVAIERFGKLMTPDGRKGMDLYEMIEATDSEKTYGMEEGVKSVCSFCPHIDYCRNAFFYVDRESFYD